MDVRNWCGRLAVSAAVVAVGIGAAGTATADPNEVVPPNCSAADLSGIAAGVAASTSVYLFSHPEINGFFTDLHEGESEDVPAATSEYFATHPVEHAELKAIRQPLTDFHNRCYPAEVSAP